MLSLNFSFHALNAAYISCICAGDADSDGPGVPGVPRCISRYFRVVTGFSSMFAIRRRCADLQYDARAAPNWTPADTRGTIKPSRAAPLVLRAYDAARQRTRAR